MDTVCLIVALVVVCLVRASKSGRAREVGGAAAVNTRALYSNTQQKPSGEGQLIYYICKAVLLFLEKQKKTSCHCPF